MRYNASMNGTSFFSEATYWVRDYPTSPVENKPQVPSGKFAVVFRRDRYPFDCVVIHDNCPTLEYAREMRKASGDIVVDSDTHLPIRDERWLWDWEKKDPKSYARSIVEKGF